MQEKCPRHWGQKISLQILSDILWVAQGVNRLKGSFGGPGRLWDRPAIQRKSASMSPRRKGHIRFHSLGLNNSRHIMTLSTLLTCRLIRHKLGITLMVLFK